MLENKFKDDVGHTVFLNSDADGLRAWCPHCEIYRELWRVKT